MRIFRLSLLYFYFFFFFWWQFAESGSFIKRINTRCVPKFSAKHNRWSFWHFFEPTAINVVPVWWCSSVFSDFWIKMQRTDLYHGLHDRLIYIPLVSFFGDIWKLQYTLRVEMIKGKLQQGVEQGYHHIPANAVVFERSLRQKCHGCSEMKGMHFDVLFEFVCS